MDAYICISHRNTTHGFYNKFIKNNFCFTESDFAFGSYEVDIPANSKEGLLSISITNDTVFEFNKTFLLIIEDGSLPQLVRAGTPRIATVTIVEGN